MSTAPELAAPGIHRLSLPTRSAWLKQVNVYLVAGPEGLLLIDTGYGTEEALESLETQLAGIGYTSSDVAAVVLTHAHPDHVGLARAIADRSGATVSLHREDFLFVDESATAARMRSIREWFFSHGMAVDNSAPPRLPLGHPVLTGFLEDGAVLAWGEHRFELLWTPGHSPGLVCLYERASRVLLSSDHVLERITPNVSIFFDRPSDPLHDYLRGLRRVGGLEVDLVLPGHGLPFRSLDRRLAEIEAHHRRRLEEVVAALASGATTAADLAPRLEWLGYDDGWLRLDDLHRRSAVGETLAHLRFLSNTGVVVAEQRDGRVHWRAHRT